MNFDLVVESATLPDGRKGQRIACRAGKIVAVGPDIEGDARETIDAGGRLVSPPFVDIHFHLDTALTVGLPRFNQSGTVLEGIQILSELQPLLTKQEVIDRAMRYCALAISQGLLAIRSHVDVSRESLLGVEALLEVRDLLKDRIDLQLVAFPQAGYYRSGNSVRNLERALDMGVNVVGGIPHHERTGEEGARSVRALCELAARRGLMVDLHCDETDDPNSRHIESLTFETMRLGLQGRVTASHLTSMHSMDNYFVAKLLPLMAEADIQVIANPLANAVLQGRLDNYPKRRGMTRVAELRSHRINVAFGHDSAMDPFYPLGNADMLDVASMGVHLGHLTSRDAMSFCFDAVTKNAAAIFGLQDYGIAPGCNADLVLLDALDPIDAIRLRASRVKVVRRGVVIA